MVRVVFCLVGWQTKILHIILKVFSRLLWSTKFGHGARDFVALIPLSCLHSLASKVIMRIVYPGQLGCASFGGVIHRRLGF